MSILVESDSYNESSEPGEPAIGKRRLRVAFLTNEIPPYRIPLYSALGATPEWDFQVFTCIDREYDRLWEMAKDVDFAAKKSYSLQYYRKQRIGGTGRYFRKRPVHLPVGVLPDLLRFRPDVVISDEFGARTVLAGITAQLNGHRLIVYCEGTPHTEKDINRAQSMVRRFLKGRVDAYVCNGVQSRQYLEALGVNRDDIVEIGQGLDIKSFDLPDREVIRQEQRALLGIEGVCYLLVGHLLFLKGVRVLIDAWKDFCGDGSRNATLLIAGEGQDRSEIEKQIAAAGLDNVRLLGFVPAEGIKKLYTAADIFVFPTLHDYFALSLVEALASGLPVIGSIYGGESELVEEGRNGWVCDPLAPGDLAEKMNQAWQCRDELPVMGQQSRRIVATMDIDLVAERIRGAVDHTLAKGLR